MTIEEFDKISFSRHTIVKYKGVAYFIESIDFEERLIGLCLQINGEYDREISWVRCENCKIYIS